MGYASKSGRARTSISAPSAFAVCDRCGIWHNFVDLSWQFDWRGAALQNTRLLVCRECLDTPSEQLRAIIIPADPTPIIQARIEPFLQDSTDYRSLTAPPVIDPTTGLPIPNTNVRVTQTGDYRVTQPIGIPVGLEQGAIMPLVNDVEYGVQLSVISIFSIGTDQISVTCLAPHGLVTNNQISVEGTSVNEAAGFYSVTVISATALTYQVNQAIPAGSLLTPTANIITCKVGLPRGFDQIPQTGV